MSDFADDASDTEIKDRERCIAAARQSGKTSPKKTSGECADGCGEKASPGSIWCSIDCRDNYEKTERMRKINGN